MPGHAPGHAPHDVPDAGSGLEALPGPLRVVDARCFLLSGETVCGGLARVDSLGHGSRVAAVIQACAPAADLLIAQVFVQRLTTSAAQVAAAIDWLVASGASVINLSLGLREPRPVLATACQRALAAGVILCAATPARGEPVYPAAHAGVWRVTGDARCARHEIAALDAAYADFGAHVRPLDGSLTGAGASIACAHLSGHLAHLLGGRAGEAAAATASTALRARLSATARYHGRERRDGQARHKERGNTGERREREGRS